MKLKELMSVVPRKEYVELSSRDEFLGTYNRVELFEDEKYSEYLDMVVFMVTADSSVLEIVLI